MGRIRLAAFGDLRTAGLLAAALAIVPAVVTAGELHEAARICFADRMRELLAQNPSVNEAEEDGRTPLHVAIDWRQIACVGLLLEAGADREALDGDGRNAYDAADQIVDRRARATIRQYLDARSGLKVSQTPTGPTPWSLEYAVLRRQTAVTKMLLEMGADPNKAGTNGTTPLADAALKGDLAAVRLLLDAGARADAVSEAGTLPIHDAALGGNAEVIRALAGNGADVNARTRDEGQTPLHLAAAMGKTDAVKALVELKADTAARDAKGRTALDLAERAGVADAVAILRAAASAP